MWCLKPCTCGCRQLKLIEDYTEHYKYRIKCSKCGRSGALFDTVKIAIDGWNRGYYLHEDNYIPVYANSDR